MKKYLIMVYILLMAITVFAAVTKTSNLGLEQQDKGDADWHLPLNRNVASLDIYVGAQHDKQGQHETITGDAIVISSDNDLIVLRDPTHVTADSSASGERLFGVGTAISYDAFSVYRSTDVSGDVVIRIGNIYFWVVESAGSPTLRISPNIPTSSDAGALVGP